MGGHHRRGRGDDGGEGCGVVGEKRYLCADV